MSDSYRSGSKDQQPTETDVVATINATCAKAHQDLGRLKEKWQQHSDAKGNAPSTVPASVKTLCSVAEDWIVSTYNFKLALAACPMTKIPSTERTKPSLPSHLDTAGIQACGDTLTRLTNLKERLATFHAITNKDSPSKELQDSVQDYMNASDNFLEPQWTRKLVVLNHQALTPCIPDTGVTRAVALSKSDLNMISLFSTGHSADELMRSEAGPASEATR